SPLAPESDEEKAGDAKPDEGKSDDKTADKPAEEGKKRGGKGADAPPKPVRIDFDKIMLRTVALPISARPIQGLEAGKAGIMYIIERGGGGGFGAGGTLSKFELKNKKLEKLADGVGAFDLSANGEKMLLRLTRPGEGGPPRPGFTPAPPEYVIT